MQPSVFTHFVSTLAQLDVSVWDEVFMDSWSIAVVRRNKLIQADQKVIHNGSCLNAGSSLVGQLTLLKVNQNACLHH